eukprot:PITA_26320
MITVLQKEYYWPGMKRDVAEYLARCLECQQIKAEHQHPARLLQPLPILEWKWETISMDCITELGTQLNFSTAYHPQTDGQTERVNQVVEYMLRTYVMQQPTHSEDYLHLVKFVYNNGYHTSLQMSPFEVLYGRKCHTPSSWGGPEDKLMLGPEMLKEMEEMVKQVEPEGENLVKPLNILDWREVQLRKQAITQVKVQWQYFGPDEATWEDEELMKKAYPGLFMIIRHRDDVQL